EQRAAKDVDIAKAEQTREKEIRRLHKELEAAKYHRIPSLQQSPGPSELPAFGKPERLNGILAGDESNAHESLADQLHAHFAWPAEDHQAELERLQEELRSMQEFYENKSSGATNQALEETQATLKTEREEVQHLRRELNDSMQSKRLLDSATNQALEETQATLKTEREEVQHLRRDLNDSMQSKRLLDSATNQALEETQANLKTEMEEVQHLRRDLNDSMQSKRLLDSATNQALEETQATLKTEREVQHLRRELNDSLCSIRAPDGIRSRTKDDQSQVKELQGILKEKEEELMNFAETAKRREKRLEDEVVQLREASARPMPGTAQSVHTSKVRQKVEARQPHTEDVASCSSASQKEPSDDVEMLRALAALRYVEAHWYP
ncbi:unnamed protein product, partial [Cladocopium goreaui]